MEPPAGTRPCVRITVTTAPGENSLVPGKLKYLQTRGTASALQWVSRDMVTRDHVVFLLHGNQGPGFKGPLPLGRLSRA